MITVLISQFSYLHKCSLSLLTCIKGLLHLLPYYNTGMMPACSRKHRDPPFWDLRSQIGCANIAWHDGVNGMVGTRQHSGLALPCHDRSYRPGSNHDPKYRQELCKGTPELLLI